MTLYAYIRTYVHVHMAALFAFDFIVGKLSDVCEEDQVHAVAFKLLGFPAVSVALVNGKKQRHVGPSGAGQSTIRLNKGKSVVFETDPKELVQGLKETPMEVFLLSSGNATSSLTPSHQPWTSPWVGRGVLDLSHMAMSLESVVVPESLHQNKSQMSHCIFSGRGTIELTDGAGRKVARLRLKCRLACVSDYTPQKVDEASSGMLHEHSEAPGRENEASPKPECREKEERGHGSLSPNSDPSPTHVHVPTSQLGAGTTATDHLNGVVNDIYLPNSVCPPPLFYHSGSKANKHLHSQPQPPSSEGAMHSAPLYTHSIWCESTAQGEGYDHWSVLAQYDQSTHPLTTQFRDLNPPLEGVHPKEPAAAQTEEPALIRHLPLLSGLLEELSCLHSRVEPAKRLPERVSTSVQTESVAKAGPKPERKKRISFSHNTTRGRFVRECCQPAKPVVKLVPRNKSVLYPPDIQRKRRRIGLAKEKLKGRDLTIPARQLPASKERAIVAITKTAARKRSECEDYSTTGGDKTKPAEGAFSPFRKLEVFIPCVPQSLSPSLSPSLSNGSSPSPSISPSPSKGSTMFPSLLRREMATLNAEIQTEGPVEKEEREGVATVPSLQTGPVETIEGKEVPVTPEEEELESEDEKSHTQFFTLAASQKEWALPAQQSGNSAVESQDKPKDMTHPQSTEAPVMPKSEDLVCEDRELNNQLLTTSASQKESVLPVPQNESSTVQLDRVEKASSPQSVDSARYVQSTRTSPTIGGSKWRQRRGSDVVHSLSRFNLSRRKFSSVGDISTAAGSPLIHSLRTSLPCVLEATASSVDLSRLQTVRSRSHDVGSQTFDSFTDMLETGDGQGILLKKRLGNSLVYLASSQSSVTSEGGWCERIGEGEEGVVKEEEEEGGEEEGRREGGGVIMRREEKEGLGSEARMAEPEEGSDQEVDYSDDFEYSDNFESSTDSD